MSKKYIMAVSAIYFLCCLSLKAQNVIYNTFQEQKRLISREASANLSQEINRIRIIPN